MNSIAIALLLTGLIQADEASAGEPQTSTRFSAESTAHSLQTYFSEDNPLANGTAVVTPVDGQSDFMPAAALSSGSTFVALKPINVQPFSTFFFLGGNDNIMLNAETSFAEAKIIGHGNAVCGFFYESSESTRQIAVNDRLVFSGLDFGGSRSTPSLNFGLNGVPIVIKCRLIQISENSNGQINLPIYDKWQEQSGLQLLQSQLVKALSAYFRFTPVPSQAFGVATASVTSKDVMPNYVPRRHYARSSAPASLLPAVNSPMVFLPVDSTLNLVVNGSIQIPAKSKYFYLSSADLNVIYNKSLLTADQLGYEKKVLCLFSYEASEQNRQILPADTFEFKGIYADASNARVDGALHFEVSGQKVWVKCQMMELTTNSTTGNYFSYISLPAYKDWQAKVGTKQLTFGDFQNVLQARFNITAAAPKKFEAPAKATP